LAGKEREVLGRMEMKKVSAIAAQTHWRGVVQGRGRVNATDSERQLENIMGSGSGEGIRFPTGREFRFGKAGNASVVVMQEQRRRLGEQAR